MYGKRTRFSAGSSIEKKKKGKRLKKRMKAAISIMKSRSRPDALNQRKA
jgi:hypothetical protein